MGWHWSICWGILNMGWFSSLWSAAGNRHWLGTIDLNSVVYNVQKWSLPLAHQSPGRLVQLSWKWWREAIYLVQNVGCISQPPIAYLPSVADCFVETLQQGEIYEVQAVFALCLFYCQACVYSFRRVRRSWLWKNMINYCQHFLSAYLPWWRDWLVAYYG